MWKHENATAVVLEFQCVGTFVPLRWYTCTNALKFFWYRIGICLLLWLWLGKCVELMENE